MFWPIVNSVCGLIAAATIGYLLAFPPVSFTLWERIGLGLAGAAMILTVGPILSPAPTPYEDWSTAMLRIGIEIFLVFNLLRHRLANAAARRQARRHLRSKGRAP